MLITYSLGGVGAFCSVAGTGTGASAITSAGFSATGSATGATGSIGSTGTTFSAVSLTASD